MTQPPPLPAVPTAGTSDVLAALRRLGDEGLAELLRHRGDLALPTPASLSALVGRATSHASVERALAGLDCRHLAVAEVVCVLGNAQPAAVSEVLGGHDASDVLETLAALLLIVDERPVAGLCDTLGPYPAGLGPPWHRLESDKQVPDAGELGQRVQEAPEAARRVLSALDSDGPVALRPSGGEARRGTEWLMSAELIHPHGQQHLLLPLEVGLAMRGGSSHGPEHLAPPTPQAPPAQAVEAVASEGARLAAHVVHAVGELLAVWQESPADLLRGGGLTARALRHSAHRLDMSVDEAATLIETAAGAGLLARTSEGQLLGGEAAEQWQARPMPQQWAALVAPWPDSARASWLVGTRDSKGTLHAALMPSLERGWAPTLRQRLLRALAEIPEGAAPSSQQLHELLSWQAPRATPALETITALAHELELMGITAGGALTAPGRRLAAGASQTEVAQALAAMLPDPVDELIVQADLTGVVPGRPTAELAALLEASSTVESRGGALTVRFTETSLQNAIAGGWEGEELENTLASYSRTPLPQSLSYLLADVARRYGAIRIGQAASYLRTIDEASAAALLAERRLAPAGLMSLSPTVLLSSMGPEALADLVHRAGMSAVLEGQAASRGPGEARQQPTPLRLGGTLHRTTLGEEELTDVVAHLRATDTEEAATSPGHTLALLRDAAQQHEVLDVVLTTPAGQRQQRRVRPLGVAEGRVRLLDVSQQAELSIAAHRVSEVLG